MFSSMKGGKNRQSPVTSQQSAVSSQLSAVSGQNKEFAAHNTLRFQMDCTCKRRFA
jgi:hypothetical protein